MSKRKQVPENFSPPEDNMEKSDNITEDTKNQNNQQTSEINQESLKNTNEMEIHHPQGIHHKKKLKDYIFEFFMLFVAVTAGFFTENIRENHVERKKEKEYILSMIKDIQEDTTNIQKIIRDNKIQIKGIDTLLTLLEKPIPQNQIRRFYYLTFRYLNSYSDFRARNITMTQLKNSGGLRLIEDKSVCDSIVFYYWEFEEHLAQLEFNIKSFQKLIEMEMDFLDLTVIKNGNRKLSIGQSFNAKKFSNNVSTLYFIIISENEWLKNYKHKGTKLLSYLKLNYKIDN